MEMSGPGRPPLYTPELAAKILERLAEGESLNRICKDPDMPSRPTIHAWCYDDVDGFFAKYVRAREMQAHAVADETLDIADDGSNDWMKANDPGNPGYNLNGEHVQRSRLRVDQRKWYAGKLHPGTYGDKQQVDVSGSLTLRDLIRSSIPDKE